MVAEDDVGLAADPLGVVGGGAWHGGVEKRLGGPPDVDDDTQGLAEGGIVQAGAEAPGGLFVEGGELELLFLEGNAGEVVFDSHDALRVAGGAGGQGEGGQIFGLRLPPPEVTPGNREGPRVGFRVAGDLTALFADDGFASAHGGLFAEEAFDDRGDAGGAVFGGQMAAAVEDFQL